MESVARMKKALRRPIRKLNSCVTGEGEKRLCAKRREKRGRCHRDGITFGKTPSCRGPNPRDPSVTRPYRADMEKERKLREVTNAQKNAQRAAMRAHFRRKYQLAQDPKDTNHLRSAGGKVWLPHELSKIIHPEAKAKDDGFNLLSAFQGLSINTAVFTGRKPCRTPTPIPTSGDACRVM
ncbi:complexin-3 [Austrofundulus limnaeus]|uniref:Complexin-3-like n=1 Tax=Austrofundulus limnaeus TaxID=52670 RepID=A0A2I4AXE9_AUSLI|nr:PREDICTED: complexin-3-like [Austrofundulus limnaeus]XP_013860177.1 PREDICTED: complexin-3-like [Austrofundulus limnaeus]